MPKEYVRSCFNTGPYGAGELPEFQVRVGWDRDAGHVQIGTVDETAPLGTRDSGLHVDLDRRGINDLIRHLRKARDQAFGRDE